MVPEQLTVDEKQPEKAGGWGTRHTVTFMLFLGMASAYTMRTNMSVAIVAMVNQTALPQQPVSNECHFDPESRNSTHKLREGNFLWDTTQQGYILSSFFSGYVVTQIPLGILAKKYGAKWFLGVGMLINSLFGLVVPPSAHHLGLHGLIAVRFIQGLGEGPIVPCTHALLAKWIPPNERSRVGAIVYAGAQFGTIISMPISGLLAGSELFGGWPSIFYFFGLVGCLWSVLFLFIVSEDPQSHPSINQKEKSYILKTVFGEETITSPPVPWKSIFTSVPFYAIIVAHIGQNFGYETLMSDLPTFMKQILHFNIKENGFYSALPYLAMWLFSMTVSIIADSLISRGHSRTIVRKVANAIGHYGLAVCLVGASFAGCSPHLTVGILAVGVGLNGAVYSGFKISHLDMSPRFAGILMSFTSCLGNLMGFLGPIVAGYIIHKRPTIVAWREVFFTLAAVYLVCNTFYMIFGSSKRQPWDNPNKEEKDTVNGQSYKNNKAK